MLRLDRCRWRPLLENRRRPNSETRSVDFWGTSAALEWALKGDQKESSASLGDSIPISRQIHLEREGPAIVAEKEPLIQHDSEKGIQPPKQVLSPTNVSCGAKEQPQKHSRHQTCPHPRSGPIHVCACFSRSDGPGFPASTRKKQGWASREVTFARRPNPRVHPSQVRLCVQLPVP